MKIKIHVLRSLYEAIVDTPNTEDDKWCMPYLLKDRHPDWMRNIDKSRLPNTFKGFAHCPVPLNMLKSTIVIPAPLDWHYQKLQDHTAMSALKPEHEVYQDRGDMSNWMPNLTETSGHLFDVKGSHPDGQLMGYAPGYSNVKFRVPFGIGFTKKTDIMVLPPFLENTYFDHPWEVMPAYISHESYFNPLVNTIVKKDLEVPDTQILEAGTPLAYITVVHPKFHKLELEYLPVEAVEQERIHRFMGKYFRI